MRVWHFVRSPLNPLINLWRSAAAYSNLINFLLKTALPIFSVFAGLFVANGYLNGWQRAYDICLAIISPAQTGIRYSWLAFLLSATGWLIVPVLAGAVVGYVVGSSLDRRRKEQRDPPRVAHARSALADMATRGTRPRRFERIPKLRDRVKTARFGISGEFVDYFLALHGGNWKLTQDHFEREVRVNLALDIIDQHDRQGVAMCLGVDAAYKVLSAARVSAARASGEQQTRDGKMESKGYCPHCP
jgi:hypothetical protein